MNESTPGGKPVDNPSIVRVGLAAICSRRLDVRDPNGDPVRLLITKRASGSIMAGYWELPGGKIEPGETPTECIVREAREELGVQVDIHEELAPVVHTYDHATVRLHTGIGVLAPGSPAAANLEVAEHRWVTAAEIASYRFLPANEGILLEIAGRMARADGVSPSD